MSEEIWKPVLGFEGKYEVSSRGRVRSLFGVPHLLKLYKIPYGYMEARLTGHHKRVHRLVLEAFVGPCPKGYQCDHINAVRDDNRLENLRWVTGRENQLNPVTRERHRRQKGNRAVVCIETGEVFMSIGEASRHTGVCNASIHGVCHHRYGRRHAGGLTFRFVEEAR